VHLYERVERLDRDWNAPSRDAASPVVAMQGRLQQAFAG